MNRLPTAITQKDIAPGFIYVGDDKSIHIGFLRGLTTDLGRFITDMPKVAEACVYKDSDRARAKQIIAEADDRDAFLLSFQEFNMVHELRAKFPDWEPGELSDDVPDGVYVGAFTAALKRTLTRQQELERHITPELVDMVAEAFVERQGRQMALAEKLRSAG
ncbi:hypothetical protein EYC87_05260 [Halieaceae bacterium IMCC8485]|uniref:Uncharacterized protein n=1 Tax=Candidatus Seongchinamella marina TaxID=2518990 RepID=A0ABT3SUH3_9GAMM|nr:hypothetical protein [Candidatus Seongchinamella marina]MCX2972992.1 hypothetical protein [Candidatus Seongchinamella marina]